MWDAWLDLVLGSTCSVCEAPGRALCDRCARSLPDRAGPCWPTPRPPGRVRPSAVGDYAPPLRPLVVDHKEHARLALARPLGRLLAIAVLESWQAHRFDGPHGAPAGGADRRDLPPRRLGLVPVPSHPAVVRRRGHDPLLRVARQAAAVLRRQGLPATVLPVLRVAARPVDQAGLGAEARAANVRGRFAVRRSALPRLGGSGRPPAGTDLVLVDDVVTTGATLREAQRALEQHGLRPVGAAVVAATRRRRAGG